MKKINKLKSALLSIVALFVLGGCQNPEESSSASESSESYEYSLQFTNSVCSLFEEETYTLKTRLFCGENLITDYSLTFESFDNSVASVSETGVVTGHKVGETKIKATVNEYECDPAYVIVKVRNKYMSIDVTNEDIINYYGRVLIENNKALLFNTASGFELTFYGTRLIAHFDRGYNQKIRIYVDGEDIGESRTVYSSTLCRGLDKDYHTVKVVRCNYEYRGPISLSSIEGAEYYVSSPEKPKTKFEFYGDSITVGCGVNADNTGDTISNEDGTLTYAYKTMLHYDAQANYLCFDGATIMDVTWRDWTIPSRYTRYSLYSDSTEWDFSKYTPDYVVINLGTNDAGVIYRGEGKVEDLTKGYLLFLQELRTLYETSKIICCYGMMGVSLDVTLAINNAVIKTNDPNIHYLEFKPVSCRGHEYHPDIEGHVDGANQLIDFIDSISELEEPTNDSYTISETNNLSYGTDFTTYELKVTKDTNNIYAYIDIEKPNIKIDGYIKVLNHQHTVNVRGLDLMTDFKPVSNNDWVKYNGISDSNNLLLLHLFSNKGETITSGTKLYLSFVEYYVPKEGTDYVVSKTTEQQYNNGTTYKIEILKENKGFAVEIKTNVYNKPVKGAVMVWDTVRWIRVTTTNYDKWFRNQYSPGDWWEGTKQWDEFSINTDSSGIIKFDIGIYERNDAGEYGPIVPGSIIYISICEN